MTLWAKSLALPQNHLGSVRNIYGEHFPFEVRYFLAHWLEEKVWNVVDPEHPQYEQYCAQFLTDLLQELEAKASSMDSPDMFINRMKLIESAAMFKQRYSSCPHSLFQLVQHCLNTEFKLVQQVETNAVGGGMMSCPSVKPDNMSEINRSIERLRQMTQQTGEDLRKMEQDQETFALHYHECSKSNAHLSHLRTQAQNAQTLDMIKKVQEQKEQQEQRLNQMAASLMQLYLTLAGKLKNTVEDIKVLQDRVLEVELINWKREQQLAGNGAQYPTSLDSIQEWCEHLAEIIWSNRQQIKEIERLKQKLGLDPQNVGNFLPDLNQKITEHLSSLVTSTFIIEKQPPQVMKTNTRFASTVRLLVGGKLNVHMTPPQVKVSIISEAQANSLLKHDKIGKSDASGEIINCSGTMEYNQASRQLFLTFRNMQLKKIKRAEKKGTESVMDEKFSLLFQSQFTVGGGELVFQVWTLSLPVVVIVHGNQEPHAWATVTWDNAFAEPGRTPFVVPEKVAWSAVAEALSMKFQCMTSRPLYEPHLRFLAEKAFRNLNCSDYSTMMLSWSQFCKETLVERNFTFWEWFYAVMKLTKEHLKLPWMDGRIHGFVRKKQAEDMLSSCANGTFLLRFSDSELGGVTIAWVRDGEVYMLQPFTSKDFSIRSLPDRISDLAHLVYLYPEIPKNEAFEKYYTPLESQPTSTNGYVKPFLVTHVPGWGGPGQGSGMSYPNTPQPSYPPHSPDPGCARDTPSVNSQLSESVSSFTGANCPVADVELPLIDENFDFPFDQIMWPHNQSIAGVKINNNNNNNRF